MVNRYPLWKNLLLIVVILLGFLYAIPNLFGENPAVQVSGKHGAMVTNATLQNVQWALTKADLPYQSANIDRQNILVRFKDTDTQLKASDILKAALGQNYTVALNLAPATPAFFQAIGALPMKLGLDLRGGVHFLLDVDVNSVVTHQQEGNVSAIMNSLRDKRIRYAGANLQADNSILIAFRDTEQQNAALNYLPNQFPDLAFVAQGNNIIASYTPAALSQVKESAIDQTMTTLRNRVNELGVSEAIVQQQGPDRVSVDLPGIQDTAHAKEILGGTATLAFRLVDTQHDPNTPTPGSTVFQYEGQPVLLKNQVILTGSSITDANATYDQNGRPAVNIQLGSGERMFNQITAENVGNPLATVYIETTFEPQTINGKVVKVPHQTQNVINIATIQSALGTNFQITGLASQQEAQNLSLLLRAGALPAAINYEEERTVGPTLGQENIHKGILSVEAAMIIVIIFMALYYRLFGLIADMALLLNIVLLTALLSILGATLTLPGIAGIVLTVGMAVDANVLIFERIREELRNGTSPQAAIYAGYERAFVTIVDANVTTLIVAMVLFGIGTDAVKGFAVTLTLGILSSMFTGIFGTRAVVNFIYGSRNVKRLSIGI